MLKLTEKQAIDYVNIERKRLSEAHGMGYYWSLNKACQTVASKYGLNAAMLRKTVQDSHLN